MYEDGGLMKALLIAYGLILAIAGIAWLVDYIFKGIGMYKIGKRRGMENSWLAFVPFARAYFQGELSGPIRFREKELKSPGLWMVFFPIVVNMVIRLVMFVAAYVIVLVAMIGAAAKVELNDFSYDIADDYIFDQIYENMFTGFSGILLLLLMIGVLFLYIYSRNIPFILFAIVNYHIFVRYMDKNSALLHTVAGILVPMYASIYFFIIRNRDECYIPENSMQNPEQHQV